MNKPDWQHSGRMGHVAMHFFTETRWKRTLHLIR